MKFHQLPVGSRFSYQGETLIKTSPLVASFAATGQQKFMPRSAEVSPLPADAAADPVTAPTPQPLLDSGEVGMAFEDFYRICRDNLDRLAGRAEGVSPEEVRAELERARARLLHRLRLPG
jgi:hypothetical protein